MVPSALTWTPTSFTTRSTLSSEAVSGLKTSTPPAIKIDNTSDAFATMVTVEIGDKILDLLETVSASALLACR